MNRHFNPIIFYCSFLLLWMMMTIALIVEG